MGAAHFSGVRSRRGRVAAVFFFLGLISLSCAGRLPASRQKLEVRKHLKRLNKPALKTIKVFLSSFECKWLFLLFCSFTLCSVWLLRKCSLMGKKGKIPSKVFSALPLILFPVSPLKVKLSNLQFGAFFFLDLLSFSHTFSATKQAKSHLVVLCTNFYLNFWWDFKFLSINDFLADSFFSPSISNNGLLFHTEMSISVFFDC